MVGKYQEVPEIAPLLRQFITVNLTSMGGIDTRIFPRIGYQDFDCSWWVYFYSPDLELYGVYGGRDDKGDQPRISLAGLASAMKRVLNHHYDSRRASWRVDGDPAGLEGAPQYFENHREVNGCVHCHAVNEAQFQTMIDSGRFNAATDFDALAWPEPQNIGLTIDPNDGLLVTDVTPDSPAAKAGLRAGDALAAAGGRRLFSHVDLCGVLYRARAERSVDIHWLRSGQVMSGMLDLSHGWAVTDIKWRRSVANIAAKRGAAIITCVRIVTVAPDTQAARVGLKYGDLIVDYNGTPVSSKHEMMSLVRGMAPGKPVTLTVERGGKRLVFNLQSGAMGVVLDDAFRWGESTR